MTQHPIRVLVVDDSAFVRKALTEMLQAEGDIVVVGKARNGREALTRVRELQPDVVTTDLMMPEWDGVAFIRAQMQARPLPIVVVSVLSENAEMVLQALEAGAVDFVQKPTRLFTDDLYTLGQALREKVRLAASVPETALRQLVQTTRKDLQPAPPPAPERVALVSKEVKTAVVVVAASTGGPQALRYLLSRLPEDFPVPLAIVQHMPEGYTAPFALRLNELSPLQVHEAQDGLTLRPGMAVLGRAGWHLRLEAGPEGPVCRLSRKPDTLHRPSADVLFASAAEAFGAKVLAVVLTGMGQDGTQGAAAIKQAGGRVLAESETSAVVYGMPRSVIEAGLADGVGPLDKLPELIVEYL